jgi:hypothetical protein
VISLVIGPIRVPADADALNNWVNFDCVDVADVVQRMVNIVARPCTDDEFILERRVTYGSPEQVN